MREQADIVRAMQAQSDTVLRVCSLYFANRPEREDAFQETWIKYAQSDKSFEHDEHCKAWLIRVATNVCKDMLKRAEARTVLVDQIDEAAQPSWQTRPGENRSDMAEALTEALLKLEEKYRVVLYLKYYECYTAAEIAKVLHIPENTVFTNLSRGREKLKEVLAHE